MKFLKEEPEKYLEKDENGEIPKLPYWVVNGVPYVEKIKSGKFLNSLSWTLKLEVFLKPRNETFFSLGRTWLHFGCV